jgi:hypothetical protein
MSRTDFGQSMVKIANGGNVGPRLNATRIRKVAKGEGSLRTTSRCLPSGELIGLRVEDPSLGRRAPSPTRFGEPRLSWGVG